ncbi:hypothetical protein V1514DRAFT_327915 [Lipomyces japonicus]|uniref:uncharacterized protein n=1 Tax=Lipomyces japonicus TaxID=56871 RepID=UPI0034CE71D2
MARLSNFPVVLIFRSVQALLAIIELGISSWLVNHYYHAVFGFYLFLSLITLIALAYQVLGPTFFPNFHNPVIVLTIESILTIFWFSGFVSLAAEYYHGLKCAIDDTTMTSPWSASCSAINSHARAATWFAFFATVAFGITLAFVIRAFVSSNRRDIASDSAFNIGPFNYNNNNNNNNNKNNNTITSSSGQGVELTEDPFSARDYDSAVDGGGDSYGRDYFARYDDRGNASYENPYGSHDDVRKSSFSQAAANPFAG